jgi:hypothetical protein
MGLYTLLDYTSRHELSPIKNELKNTYFYGGTTKNVVKSTVFRALLWSIKSPTHLLRLKLSSLKSGILYTHQALVRDLLYIKTGTNKSRLSEQKFMDGICLVAGVYCAGIFKQYMRARRNREGIGLSYRPAWRNGFFEIDSWAP